MFKRVAIALLRIVLGMILLFATGAMAWTLLLLPGPLRGRPAAAAAAVGFGLSALLFGIGFRLVPLYVLGHELTHWFAAKCFLRRTGPLRVNGGSGSVAIERPNVWIVLAPYFVPLYTLLWIGLYGVYQFWLGAPGPGAQTIFYAGLGLTYAFHLLFTIHALRRAQSDLRAYGRFFSLAMIAFCNVALVLVAALIAGGQWSGGRHLLGRHLVMQWRALAWLVERVGALLGLLR